MGYLIRFYSGLHTKDETLKDDYKLLQYDDPIMLTEGIYQC